MSCQQCALSGDRCAGAGECAGYSNNPHATPHARPYLTLTGGAAHACLQNASGGIQIMFVHRYPYKS